MSTQRKPKTAPRREAREDCAMTDDEPWNHVIDPDGTLWRWRVEGSSVPSTLLGPPGVAEDEGLIRADHPVGALRWLVTDGPVYGYGELDFHEEFTITIGPADAGQSQRST